MPLLKVQQILKCVKSTPVVKFYLFVDDKLYTKKLLVVLECLKDRAFDRADCLRLFFAMPVVRSVVVCKACINYLKLHSIFSIICSWCEAIFSQDVAKEGR